MPDPDIAVAVQVSQIERTKPGLVEISNLEKRGIPADELPILQHV